MSMYNRAAQFAPFAALSGHDAAIAETARLTSVQQELSDDQQANLQRRLEFAKHYNLKVSITYFVEDEKKSGGEYVVSSGLIKKIDNYERCLFLDGGEAIRWEMIKNIEAPELEEI